MADLIAVQPSSCACCFQKVLDSLFQVRRPIHLGTLKACNLLSTLQRCIHQANMALNIVDSSAG